MASKKHQRNTGNKLWTPARIAIAIVVLSLIAAIGISSYNSGYETAKRSEPVPPAANPPVRKVPEARAELTNLPSNLRDAELRSLTGRPIKLADYAGKVMLVNFWASWCGPCKIEIPELVKLHKEFKSQGLEMVGLSMENPDASAETVRNFVRDFRMDYRVGWATPEVAVTLMQGRDAIPQSFVISGDGRILKRFVGFNPTDTPAQIRQVIEEALRNKS
jgi:peroxiredoxin